jgi:hypothetical protein
MNKVVLRKYLTEDGDIIQVYSTELKSILSNRYTSAELSNFRTRISFLCSGGNTLVWLTDDDCLICKDGVLQIVDYIGAQEHCNELGVPFYNKGKKERQPKKKLNYTRFDENFDIHPGTQMLYKLLRREMSLQQMLRFILDQTENNEETRAI